MRIGIDLDHTTINYGLLFYKIAQRAGWISHGHSPFKQHIRQTLKKQGQEKNWRTLQGLVYGREIKKATLFEGADVFFSQYKEQSQIISHKSFLSYDNSYLLQFSALSWIKGQKALEGVPITFASSLEEKCKIIHEKNCQVFIDDLPEVLLGLKPEIKKILFDPLDLHAESKDYKKFSSWSQIHAFIGK